MTEAKHTPGPWHTFDDPKSNYGVQVNADHAVKAKKVICRLGGPDRIANARLIAAAPEMRDLLEMAATILWAKGANGEARKIDQFLEGLG